MAIFFFLQFYLDIEGYQKKSGKNVDVSVQTFTSGTLGSVKCSPDFILSPFAESMSSEQRQKLAKERREERARYIGKNTQRFDA